VELALAERAGALYVGCVRLADDVGSGVAEKPRMRAIRHGKA